MVFKKTVLNNIGTIGSIRNYVKKEKRKAADKIATQEKQRSADIAQKNLQLKIEEEQLKIKEEQLKIDNYSNMKYTELRDLAKQRGISTSRKKKAVLILELIQYDQDN